jgi:hypothetical protein
MLKNMFLGLERRLSALKAKFSVPKKAFSGMAVVGSCMVLSSSALGAQSRERAIEEIPELVARIAEGRRQISESIESLEPVNREFDKQIEDRIEDLKNARGEDEVFTASVDVADAYEQRLRSAERGLAKIEPALVRIRVDAQALQRAIAAEAAGSSEPIGTPMLAADQWQGLAQGFEALADGFGNTGDIDEAAFLLDMNWVPEQTPEPIPLPGGDTASVENFLEKVDFLHARFLARKRQINARRLEVRQFVSGLMRVGVEQEMAALMEDTDLGSAFGGAGLWRDIRTAVSHAYRGAGSITGAGSDRKTEGRRNMRRFADGEHRQ